jgi:hypothetical protein
MNTDNKIKKLKKVLVLAYPCLSVFIRGHYSLGTIWST